MFSFLNYGLVAVQFLIQFYWCIIRHLKNTKLYSIEFLRTEMTSDSSNDHREYSPYGSYSLLQFEGSDVISVLKNSIEYSFVFFKGELQRQNKLISFERPFKILQNETKFIKIGQAVLEILNFKDRDLDTSARKNDRKTENVVFFWSFCTN